MKFQPIASADPCASPLQICNPFSSFGGIELPQSTRISTRFQVILEHRENTSGQIPRDYSMLCSRYGARFHTIPLQTTRFIMPDQFSSPLFAAGTAGCAVPCRQICGFGGGTAG